MNWIGFLKEFILTSIVYTVNHIIIGSMYLYRTQRWRLHAARHHVRDWSACRGQYCFDEVGNGSILYLMLFSGRVNTCAGQSTSAFVYNINMYVHIIQSTRLSCIIPESVRIHLADFRRAHVFKRFKSNVGADFIKDSPDLDSKYAWLVRVTYVCAVPYSLSEWIRRWMHFYK